MKKLTKALAVILTVCVLAGAFALFASAETVSQLNASQYGEGISNYLAADFENFAAIDSFVSAGGGKVGTEAVSMTPYADMSKKGTITVGEETNTFMSITSKKQDTPALKECTSYPFAYIFVNKAGDILPGKYDFVTLDFDIAAVGEGTYLDGAAFGPYMVKPTYPAYIYTVTDGDNWYLSNKNTYAAGGSTVMISDEIGVWNHVTYIFDVKGATDGVMDVHTYVNETPLYTFSVTLNLEKTEVQRLAATLSVNMGNETYCYAVDNVTSNKYAVGYASGGNGIDTFLAGGALGSPGRLSDVVYQAGYTYLAAKESQYYVVDGVKYALSTAAADAIKDGSVVEICRNLHIDVADIGKYDFTVSAKNGAGVTVDEEVSGMFVTEKISEADGVRVLKIKKIVDECPAGVTTQKSYTYSDGSLVYNTHLQFSGNFTPSIQSFGENKFVQITDKSTATLTKNGLFRLSLVDNLGSTTEQLRTSYDYQILDFDFSTSSNYFKSMSFGVYRNSENRWSWLGDVKVDGSGNCVISRKETTKKITITDEEFDWVHITAVISGETGLIDVYVNGEYFYTADEIVGENDRVERLDVFFNTGTTVHPFTLNLDNVILRSYAKGYNSGDAIFGIDDYKALGDNTLPIYGLEDVVYGPKYGYDSITNVDYAATTASGNYYVPTGAFANAKNGDVITLSKDVTLMKMLSEEVETLTINGGNVNLVGEAARYYTYADGVLSRNAIYTVNVYDENGSIINTFENGVDLAPDISLFDLETSILGDYKQALAWNFKIDDGEELPFSAWEGAPANSVVSLIPNTAYVMWLDNYGEMLGEDPELWFVGSVADRSFEDLEELGLLENGWYELQYFWTSEAEDVYDTTIVEDCAFSAIVKPVAAFSGLKINFTLGLHYRPNFYVPVPTESEIELKCGKYADGVVTTRATKAYFDDIEECVSSVGYRTMSPDTVVDINGSDYYKFQGDGLSAYTWYSAIAFEVIYTVNYEGDVYELSSNVALTRIGAKNETAKSLNYVSAVLANSSCGKDTEAALMINWINYINQSYRSQGTHVLIDGITNILKKHTDCGCLETFGSAIPKAAPEYDVSELTALNGKFALGYRVNYSAARLAVYVPVSWVDANEGKEIAITSTYKGIDNATASIKNITSSLELLTKLDEENSTVDNEIYVPDTTTINGEKCYIYLISREVGVYNANAVQNIAITVDGETVAEATYSLAAYLYNLNQSMGLYKIDETSGEYVVDESKLSEGAYSQDQILYECALAFANFGKAAYDYKVN